MNVRVLESLNMEDFRVSNQDRPITDVAREKLERAAGLPPASVLLE